MNVLVSVPRRSRMVTIAVALALLALSFGTSQAQITIKGREGVILQPANPDQAPSRAKSDSSTLVLADGNSDIAVRNQGGNLLLSTFAGLRAGNLNASNVGRYTDHVTVRPDGNVGIGVNTPAHRLSIEGGPVWTANGWKGALELENASAIAWKANEAGQLVGIGHTNGGLYFFRTTSKTAERSAPAVYDLEIRDDGTVAMRAMEIMGADLAEKFEIRGASDATKMGLIVSIDPQNEGTLVISDRPYDRRVAGVISGAGGVGPGVVMGQGIAIAGVGYPVALTGRVYCWVDASTGPVRPGDLLTTSSRPGHAMKVTNHARAQGAIIGKAMGLLENGTGLVLVLVTLQ